MRKLLISLALLLISCAHLPHKSSPSAQADSVVIVVVRTANTGWSGTGFSIGDHRILTNKHVCAAEKDGEYTLIDNDNKKHSAKYIKSDDMADVCLLETDTDLPALPLAKEDAKSGDKVMAIGAPLGLFPHYTDGFISGYKTISIVGDIDGHEFGVLFKAQITSVPIYPGNSGSPCINERGEVVGIFFAGSTRAEHITMIVPVNIIHKFLNEKDNVKERN